MEERSYNLGGDITKVDTPAVCFWIQRFVLEVRRGDGKCYCPDSLYQLCCGLQRALMDDDRDVNLFDDFQFAHDFSGGKPPTRAKYSLPMQYLPASSWVHETSSLSQHPLTSVALQTGWKVYAA